jgi:hypothetical protein
MVLGNILKRSMGSMGCQICKGEQSRYDYYLAFFDRRVPSLDATWQNEQGLEATQKIASLGRCTEHLMVIKRN